MQRNEAWYKGELVHRFVPLEDPDVERRVAELILEKGPDFLREAEDLLEKANHRPLNHVPDSDSKLHR